MEISLVWKIIVAAIIVISFIIITRTIISLFNKLERCRGRHKEAIEAAAEATRKINLLTEGDNIYMNQQERMMVLSALEYVPFKKAIELPETKYHVRGVYRRIREKIQILIRKEEREAREAEPEAKDDDETKEVPK